MAATGQRLCCCIPVENADTISSSDGDHGHHVFVPDHPTRVPQTLNMGRLTRHARFTFSFMSCYFLGVVTAFCVGTLLGIHLHARFMQQPSSPSSPLPCTNATPVPSRHPSEPLVPLRARSADSGHLPVLSNSTASYHHGNRP